MDFFPINLNIKGAQCTIIGGGPVAARKAEAVLAAGAQVRAISPEACPELLALLAEPRFSHKPRPYQTGDLEGAFLVIAATDDEEVQREVWEEANRLRILVNVADVPCRCNFILPATMRAGDLSISVSTGGRSPAMARFIRKRLEKDFACGYPELTAIMGVLRPFILGLDLDHDQKRDLFSNLIHEDLLLWIEKAELAKIKEHIEKTIAQEMPDDIAAAVSGIVQRSRKTGGTSS